MSLLIEYQACLGGLETSEVNIPVVIASLAFICPIIAMKSNANACWLLYMKRCRLIYTHSQTHMSDHIQNNRSSVSVPEETISSVWQEYRYESKQLPDQEHTRRKMSSLCYISDQTSISHTSLEIWKNTGLSWNHFAIPIMVQKIKEKQNNIIILYLRKFMSRCEMAALAVM